MTRVEAGNGIAERLGWQGWALGSGIAERLGWQGVGAGNGIAECSE